MPDIEQPIAAVSHKDLASGNVVSPVGELLKRFGLDLNITGGATIPLEVLGGKIVDYFAGKRENMSQKNRDRWDDIELTGVENVFNGGVDLANKGGANFKKVGEGK